MKKTTLIMMMLMLTCLLFGCGAQESAEEVPETPPAVEQTEQPEQTQQELSLALETDGFSEEYVKEQKDGAAVLLASCVLSYPKLTVVSGDGAPYEPSAQTGSLIPREVAIAESFNAEMSRAMEEQKTSFAEYCVTAEDHYSQLDAEAMEWWGNYALEVICASEENETFLSVLAEGYSFRGGAHPSTFYQAWNFDLTTGEFFALADLAADEAACRSAVAEEILRQIYEAGMNEGYFEDFEALVRDLAYTQICFGEDGMTVYFDPYTLGPYAAGTPVFTVAYEVFADQLNDYGKALLGL